MYAAMAGWSLFEILLVIALLAVLVTNNGLHFGRVLKPHTLHQQHQALMHQLRVAQAAALQQGQAVLVCGMDTSCHSMALARIFHKKRQNLFNLLI